jgi:hypothetical protein
MCKEDICWLHILMAGTEISDGSESRMRKSCVRANTGEASFFEVGIGSEADSDIGENFAELSLEKQSLIKRLRQVNAQLGRLKRIAQGLR